MKMAHDFKKFPELTNNQMRFYYFDSPHVQIVDDFWGKVTKVVDGDTIRLEIEDRDFDFPLRMENIAAPERNEKGGLESHRWLESQLLGEEVLIRLSDARVEKWGRLLGSIIFEGLDMGKQSIFEGHAISWDRRDEGRIGVDL